MSAARRCLSLLFVLACGTLAAGGSGVIAPGNQAPHAFGSSDSSSRISDEDFWRLVNETSESGGFFQSDNFVSNEMQFQTVIPDLARRIRSGSAYLGVGPEQNFSYIVALRPRVAFIVDIRRQNLLEHLMYKAVIELSSDRAEFLFRLFSRKRPAASIGPNASVKDLFEDVLNGAPDDALYRANLHAIIDLLVKKHGFALSTDDQATIGFVDSMFFSAGPSVEYNLPMPAGRGFGRGMPNYIDLMLATDGRGVDRSYLASEDAFAALKAFERDNRLVPVVGDFAGTKALRGVGRYLKQEGTTVGAFYLSNVEQYLFQDPDNWRQFYANVATLPTDASSTFIRSCFQSQACGSDAIQLGRPIRSAQLLEPISDLLDALKEGKIQSYYDVIARSKEASR